jgi:integrase
MDYHFGRERKDRLLSASQRADARAALALLQGSGLSLEAAARRALEGRAALQHVTVEDCADRFLRARLGSCRDGTWGFYESKLNALRDAFGSRRMDEVSRADFRAWLAALDCTETTRAGYMRAARALWRWAAAQEPPLAGPTPTTGLSGNVSTRGSTIAFLTVAEVAGLMAEATHWRPALALMLFAGVRVEEVAGESKPPLTWRHLDVAEKVIRIPAECAKTGRARLMQGLPPAVWAWLGSPRPDTERIAPGQSLNAVRWAQQRLGRPWPKNALRHTFATYAVALTGEPDRVAGWLGHEGGARLLHAHYAGLARRAEGEAFFALRPAKA